MPPLKIASCSLLLSSVTSLLASTIEKKIQYRRQPLLQTPLRTRNTSATHTSLWRKITENAARLRPTRARATTTVACQRSDTVANLHATTDDVDGVVVPTDDTEGEDEGSTGFASLLEVVSYAYGLDKKASVCDPFMFTSLVAD